MNGIHSITLLTCINACSSVITQDIQHCPGLWNWFNWHCSFIKCILLLYSGTAGSVCSIDKMYSCLILPQRHIPLKVITWATGRRKQSAGSSPSCTPFSPRNTLSQIQIWRFFQQNHVNIFNRIAMILSDILSFPSRLMLSCQCRLLSKKWKCI